MRTLFPVLALAVLSACAPKPSVYTITGGGLTMEITDFGARVMSLTVPDRNGECADVVLGFDAPDKYASNPGERFLGASPGPVANRIGGASFTLDGQEYKLDRNDGNNTLHGGFTGIDNLLWDVLERSDSSILMQVVHPDGLGGFPGNKTINARFTLTADSALKVEFTATTDAPTLINLAHHSFFNLKGSGQGDILGHVLTINASHTTPVDSELIPTGEIVSLDGSPLDFREPHTIGERVDADDEQLRFGHGYDHNWVIDTDAFCSCKDGHSCKCGGTCGKPKCSGLVLDATVYEPESGRFMEVWSDQPGLQFYSGNFFGDGKTVDRYGNAIAFRGAIALETQKFPDSINHPGFSDTVLRPGETYSHTCLYKFSVR